MHPDPHSPLPTCTCGCSHKADPPPRLALVAHLREQIDRGHYVTPGKIQRTAERLSNEVHRVRE